MFTAAEREIPNFWPKDFGTAFLKKIVCIWDLPTRLAAEKLYVGFWTDKGTCDESIAAFLRSITHQLVFLFGTAGFGGAPAYFEKILAAVKENISETATVTGSYMCQGKMPVSVRKRYESMEESAGRQAMLDNFDRALSHPDEQDLSALVEAARQ